MPSKNELSRAIDIIGAHFMGTEIVKKIEKIYKSFPDQDQSNSRLILWDGFVNKEIQKLKKELKKI